MVLFEKWLRGLFVILLAGVLGACGGSGSSGGGSSGGGSTGDDDPVSGEQSPAAPEVSLTIDAVKTFRFDWADVTDATVYRLLENPDGMSGFTSVGEDIEPGTETLELTVPLYERVNAQYILQACNAAGCRDSETLFASGNLVSGIGYVKASNTEAGDSFGSAVSLSADGHTLAVGATGEDSNATLEDGVQGNNSASNAGAVYVFVREADRWSQQAYLKASNAESLDGFGDALSLSADGDTLAVVAIGEDSAATGVNSDQSDNEAESAGAVYVFAREAGTWSQQAYLKASNTDASDLFGSAVSLSANGDSLAVGAVGEDGEAQIAGAVYVFAREAGIWSQQTYLKASNAGFGDQFGGMVSLSADGDTLAVGAIGEDSAATGVIGDQSDNSASSAGAVYVFVRGVDGWSQQAYLKASNADTADYFGSAISLSADGNTLAVGARREGSAAAGVNGDQSDNLASNSGAVYVFTRDAADTWSQQAYLKASNTGTDDYFGHAVSLSADGHALAVGAPGDDSAATGVNGPQYDDAPAQTAAGAVYVFTREAGTWSQKAYLKASNTSINVLPDGSIDLDYFGSAVSLSADGHALAVGANEEDSAATGVNGNQIDDSAIRAGAVYLY